MAGQAVLEELPAWLDHVQKMGIVCKEIFREVELASGGAVTCQGQVNLASLVHLRATAILKNLRTLNAVSFFDDAGLDVGRDL